MTSDLSNDLRFPRMHPEGFPPLQKEPEFDASKHLALETPETIVTLADLGYAADEIAVCPTDLGITSVFRVLSDDGAACLQEVSRLLEPYARSNPRIARTVRGGVYQSKFLRDLCLSPELTDAISRICNAPMLPHTIPHQLGHLNYNPLEVGQNVDKWHVDTLRVDFVMFVTDPNAVEGGEFQYFNGTKHKVAALTKAGTPLPEDKIVSPARPGPGYAILQQGNMVVHRAKGLSAPGERITMVNGYVAAKLDCPDYTRFDQLYLVDPPNVAASEYARHMAWRGREALHAQIENFEFTEDRQGLAMQLDAVAKLLSGAAEELRDADNAQMEHFGDG